jgi:serine/threonine protein kinase
MHVVNSNDPPDIPADLSLEGKDFILSCLKRNPCERLNVYQLLRHPFIVGSPSVELPASPASDLFSSDSTKFASGSPVLCQGVESPDLRESNDVCFDSLDPSHTVHAPFSILMASLNKPIEDKPEEAMVLQRPSITEFEVTPSQPAEKQQEEEFVLGRPSFSESEGSCVVFSVSESL